jgi:uncharacterized membrane protein
MTMAYAPENRPDGSAPHFDEGPFEPLEALSWGWSVLRAAPERIGVPLVVASFIVVISATLIPSILGGLARFVVGSDPETFLGTVLIGVSRLFGFAISLFVSAYVSTGVYPFVLNVARGKPVEISDLLKHQDKFSRCLGLTFAMGVAIGIGSAFCVVPGAAVLIFTSLAMPLLVDLDMSVVAALRASYELVRVHFAPVAVFCVLSFVVILVGTLLCFAGAVLVSIPVVLLAQAYVYLRLHGETPVSA